MKLCKECDHFSPVAVGFCHHPNNGVVDLVHGGTKSVFASSNRGDEKRCGKDGKWWAEYQPPPQKPWWKIWSA